MCETNSTVMSHDLIYIIVSPSYKPNLSVSVSPSHSHRTTVQAIAVVPEIGSSGLSAGCRVYSDDSARLNFIICHLVGQLFAWEAMLSEQISHFTDWSEWESIKSCCLYVLFIMQTTFMFNSNEPGLWWVDFVDNETYVWLADVRWLAL